MVIIHNEYAVGFALRDPRPLVGQETRDHLAGCRRVLGKTRPDKIQEPRGDIRAITCTPTAANRRLKYPVPAPRSTTVLPLMSPSGGLPLRYLPTGAVAGLEPVDQCGLVHDPQMRVGHAEATCLGSSAACPTATPPDQAREDERTTAGQWHQHLRSEWR